MRPPTRNLALTLALAAFVSLAGLVLSDNAHADFACDLCGWVVEEAEKPLAQCRNHVNPDTGVVMDVCTLEDATKAVQGTCSRAPAFLEQPCDSFLGRHERGIVFYMLEGHSGDAICKGIGECP